MRATTDFSLLWKLIRVSLPTLCLSYGWSLAYLPNLQVREEVFANPEMFFQIQYSSVGFAGIGPSSDRQAFQGWLATNEGQEAVTGQRFLSGNGWVYVWKTSKGDFRAIRPAHSKRCEPLLHFQKTQGPELLQSGYLKGAFCDS